MRRKIAEPVSITTNEEINEELQGAWTKIPKERNELIGVVKTQNGEKLPGVVISFGLTHPGCEGHREPCPLWRQLTGQQLMRVAVSRGQGGVGVVAGLVVVVFHVQTGHLGVVDAEGAAAVVNVLPVQRLRKNATIKLLLLWTCLLFCFILHLFFST